MRHLGNFTLQGFDHARRAGSIIVDGRPRESHAEQYLKDYGDNPNVLRYRIASKARQVRPVESLSVISEAHYKNLLVRQYENGTISVLVDGAVQPVAKPLLREIAAEIGVDLLNSNSQPKNTRQLGADMIKNLQART